MGPQTIEDKLVFNFIHRMILKMPLQMVQYAGKSLFVKSIKLQSLKTFRSLSINGQKKNKATRDELIHQDMMLMCRI